MLHAIRHKTHDHGFTLIELIVSVGLTSLIIVIAVGIYIYAIGSQQKSTATADLQQDGQNLLNMIAKDVRNNRLDYNYYTEGITTPENKLALIDDSNSSSYNYLVYYFNAAGKEVERCEKSAAPLAPNPCLTYTGGEDDNFGLITMTDIQINQLSFYIVPTEDPFVTGSTTPTIPRVTVSLELGSLKERFGQKLIQLQETISQRYLEKK